MKRFNNYYDLKDYLLNDAGFQSYSFDQAFDEFEAKTMAIGALSQHDDSGTKGNFEWLNEDGKEVNVTIHFCVDENDERYYITD